MKRFAFMTVLAAVAMACGAPTAETSAAKTGAADGTVVERDEVDGPGARTASETADESEATSSARTPRTSDLFVKTFGDAKDQAVIFVHGGPGSNSFDFESSAAPALARRGFFVIAYDQRGCGRSPKGTIADYHYDKSGDDLDDLIFTLKLERPVLLGHSFGGSVALHYVDRHPNRAKGVVLAGSPINFPAMYRTILRASQEAYMARFMKPKADSLRELETKMFPKGLEGPFPYDTADIVKCTQEMVQPGIAMTRFPSPGAMQIRAGMLGSELANAFNEELGEGYQQHDKVGHRDFTALLAKHKAEVWAAYGDEDGIFDRAQLSSIESTIGAGHFATIAGASHWSFIDNTDGFVAAVSTHLNAMK